MKLRDIIVSMLCLVLYCPLSARQYNRISINEDWKFILSDISEAKNEVFDDTGWRTLDIPHDWAFENGISISGAQGDKGGYASGGIGWYRKHIILTPGKDEKIFVDFDAVYMNSSVWVNGQYVGTRPYGYISFSYDITDFIHDGENIISVRVDNSREPSARWYHGCGIYGNVFLRRENHLHFKKDGVFVRTSEVTETAASILVSCELSRLTDFSHIMATIVKNDNKVCSVHSSDTLFSIRLDKPELWSPDSPELYELIISLYDSAGHMTDEESVRFGIRTMHWDNSTGFYLNGNSLKIRGVCEHLEGGPVGAAWTEDLMRWKLQLIKDMGCNAIRTAHNPQLPFFYDICDEIGLLVVDEAFDGWKQKALWDYGRQAFDEWWHRDLVDMIRRDRNHPCVILYSVGNETKGDVAPSLVECCHINDNTRYVTSGRAETDYMDIMGINGDSEEKGFFENFKVGNKPFIATEAPHTWQVRGFYRTKTWYRDGYPNKKRDPFYIADLTDNEIFGYDWTSPDKKNNTHQNFNSSYDNATVRISVRQNLEILRDSSWYAGHFRWTGFDYMGETRYVHGGWPFRAFMGGVIDLAGFEKDHYYLYQSQWRNDIDLVHILPHWTHPTIKTGTRIPVWVYSTGDEVELFLNGESLGKRKRGQSWCNMQFEWMVPWTEGKLTAVAYKSGKESARTSVSTASGCSKLDIHIKDASEICGNTYVITFCLEDAKGTVFPYGDNRVYLSCNENVEILAFENGNPVDTETVCRANSRRAFFGKCRAFVRKTGKNPEIFVGSINGDRSLKISNKVSIGVQKLSKGNTYLEDKKIRILYTTDGTNPEYGKEYTGAFEVSPGTVVKAAVFYNNDLILEMTDSFCDGTGIYWGIPGEDICTTESGLQAELADLKQAVVQYTQNKDVNGGGYIRLLSPGSTVSWFQENDGGDVSVILVVRYSQQIESGLSTMELWQNGEFVRNVIFENTGSPDSDWRGKKIKIKLLSGSNNIALKSISANNPNIDEIYFEFK